MNTSSYKNKHEKRRKLALIITAVIILLGIVGTFAYIYREDIGLTKKSENKDQNIDYGPPTTEQIEGEKTAEQQEDPTRSSGKSDASSPSIEITSANQNGNTLQIRTIIQLVTNSGVCNLKLTHGNETITKTTNVQPATTYSTCQGFNISTSGMSKGVWSIDISYTQGSTSSSTKGSVTIN